MAAPTGAAPVPRRRGRRGVGGAAALLFGALPALAFPAPGWWWLAWIGLTPLMLLVRGAATPLAGGLRAWCGMAGFVLATQYWLAPSAGPALVLMAALLGALWLPWGWLTHRLLAGAVTPGRALAAALLLPSAWVLAEAVKSWQHLGGPWALLGASQWNQPAMLASAAMGGVLLTSYLVVGANTALVGALLLHPPRHRAVLAVVAIACAALGPAWFVLGPAPAPGPRLRVALVQPGPIDDAADRQAAGEAITAGLVDERADLVVWGESSVGVDLDTHPEQLRRLTGLSRQVGADLLVNVDARANDGAIYKSSVLIGPQGERGSYRKTRLVPFGEYVPLRPVFGRLLHQTKAAGEDRRRGAGPAVLQAGDATIGPLISFEATFSDLPRRAVQLGAQLLVYQSSTSTFQGSWAQPQLAGEAAVHAVEVGRPAVHTGLSGVSSAFDAQGHRLAWNPATRHGAVVVDVPLESVPTPYQRFGNWILALAISLLASASVITALRGWRRSTARRQGSVKAWCER